MHDLQVHWLQKRDRQWRARRLDWDRAWLGAAGTSDVEVRLTPAATTRFIERFIELAREAEAESAADPGAEIVSIHVQAVPIHPDDLV